MRRRGPTRLHPNLAKLYRKKVARLQDALVDPVTKTEALEAVLLAFKVGC